MKRLLPLAALLLPTALLAADGRPTMTKDIGFNRGTATLGDLIYWDPSGNFGLGGWVRIPRGSDGDCLGWGAVTTHVPAPQPCASGGSGITTLNGLTADPQSFAKVDDTNVTIAISSATATHTFTLGWTGLLGLARGGLNADLSGTGGAHFVLRQSSAGAAVTVSQLACADLSDGAAGCSATALPPSGSAGGDLDGSYPNPGVVKINGTSLAGLGTGILKNTTGTGVPSIAVAGDFPTLNQSTSGNAATATALAANGTNCGAGQFAAGVDASGNAEGCATPTGGGTVTHTGALTSGQLLKGNGADDITVADLSGDVTTSGGTATAVAKIQGTSVTGTTGTGKVVLDTSPTLATPNLGTPSAVNLSNATGLPCGAMPALTGDATTSSGSCATAVGRLGNAIGGANVDTDQSTSSTSYTDLATTGPAVTLTTGTSVVVTISVFIYRVTAAGNSGFCSVAVSGATTLAASDANSMEGTSSNTFSGGFSLSRTFIVTGLTAGSNTFTLKYRVDGATFHFVRRSITVMAL